MVPSRRRLLQFGALASVAVAGRPGAALARGLTVPPVPQQLTTPGLIPNGALGLVAAETPAMTLVSSEAREVELHNLHTGERLKAIYFDQGRYLADAMQAVSRVLRDFRTGDVYPMRPQLMDVLHTLSTKVESKAPFEIISGYRSPRTNAMLREASGGVAAHSLHMQGMASDIRLPGLALSDLHRAALELGRGGVGYYPVSDFVHVDVGPVRRWG